MSSNDHDKNVAPFTVPLIYYPNECFICKASISLKRCSRCNMISYCKRDHQLDHWESHREICKVISAILKEKGVAHIFENCRGYNTQKWQNAKEEVFQEVKTRLRRPLIQHEEQMFYYPRSCFVCHDSNQESLKNCPNCPNASFCSEHPSSPIHDEDCPQIQECHDIDYLYLREKSIAFTALLSLAIKVVESTPIVKSKLEKLPKSLEEFKRFAKIPTVLSAVQTFYLEEFLTLSLIAFNALQKLKLLSLSKLIIHTSNAYQNAQSAKSWEILFHLMPNLTQLKIIMVSEEEMEKQRCKLCDKCRQSKKKLFIQTLKDSYINYAGRKNFEEPGLVLLMNQNPPSAEDEVYRKMWKLMLMTWGIVTCPLVMLTFTEERARIAKESIESTFNKVAITFYGQNDFASRKPNRLWENERIFRGNDQMIIFKVTHVKEILTCDRCGIVARTVDAKTMKCAGCEADLISSDSALFSKQNDNRHRNFYYVDCCQVCHFRPDLRRNFRPLIPCKLCQLISYCSKEHQLEHWPQHKDLCKVIFNMICESGCENLYKEGKKDDSVWLKSRINLMLEAEKNLGRNLLIHEKEIFLFPKACFMCHDTNSNYLTTCVECGLKLCANHQNCLEHEEICSNVVLTFKCDNQLLTVKQSPAPITVTEAILFSTRKKILSAIPFTDSNNFPNAMSTFINSYVNLKDQRDWEESHPQHLSTLRQMMYADIFSRPLTLLYTMKRFEWSFHLNVIHVIGSTDDEICEAGYWEVLLHFVTSLKHIEIVFIGPELSEMKTVKIEVCRGCFENGKSLEVKIVPLRYDQYFESESFAKPDIIVGFNLQMYESSLGLTEDTWEETVFTLTKVNAPYVMTSKTIDKADLDDRRLKEILGKDVFSHGFIVNLFMGFSLERDYLTERFERLNQYLIVYNQLYGLKIRQITENLDLTGNSISEISES